MALESDKTSIKQIIQWMAGGETEVVQGIVKSVSPLKIQITNDDKLVITENITYVPKHLTNYTVEVDMPEDRIEITIRNALKVNETVYVLSFKHGKQYYVLDRVGG